MTTTLSLLFRSAASAVALEAKVGEQVCLALGGGQARLHVREAQLLPAANGPQRADHEAAWMVKGRGMGDCGGGSLEPPRQWLGAPVGRPLPLGASSSPEPPGAPWGCATAELGPCQGGRDIWPCWAAACVEAPVRVGVAAVVEHRHRRAQSHAHLCTHVRGRPRRSGRPPARLGLGRAAMALVRHVFVQSEGVAVDLGERIYGSGWEDSGRSGHSPHTTAATRHTPHAIPPPSY